MTAMIAFNYRAKVRAPHLSSSTNGYVYRYFLTWTEAAYCEGRVGVPEFSPGNAKGPRPQWLIDAQAEHGRA
jgi:hypothetical protein